MPNINIDTILGIIGTVLGVVGIITGYIFYLKGQRKKEPCWSINSVNLIKGYSSLFSDLEIKYKGQLIENLTVSKVVFWNNGNETIDNRDIAIPVMIHSIEDIKILDVKVLKVSNIANKFRGQLADNGEGAILLFDYLDSKQGAVIQVIHTGVSVINLVVRGEIKGVKKIEFRTKRPNVASRLGRIVLYFYAFLIVTLMGFDLYYSIFRRGAVFSWFNWMLAITALMMVIAVIYDIRFSSNMARVPKELSVFEKNDKNIEYQ